MLNEKEKNELLNIKTLINFNIDLQREKNNKKSDYFISLLNECLVICERLLNNKKVDGYNLHISDGTAKMEFIRSLSTYQYINTNCKNFSKVDGSICKKCYARKYIKLYTLDAFLIKNSLLLAYSDLSKKQLENICLYNTMFFRFESFGDLLNERHLKNLLKICKYYKRTNFALFTKNVKIVKNVFETTKQPKNLFMVFSSLMLNQQTNNFIKVNNMRIFTVYDKAHIESVDFNCEKKCITCLKCYTKQNVIFINELLK